MTEQQTYKAHVSDLQYINEQCAQKRNKKKPTYWHLGVKWGEHELRSLLGMSFNKKNKWKAWKKRYNTGYRVSELDGIKEQDIPKTATKKAIDKLRNEPSHKVCKRCGETKHKDEFYLSGTYRVNYCKICYHAKAKEAKKTRHDHYILVTMAGTGITLGFRTPQDAATHIGRHVDTVRKAIRYANKCDGHRIRKIQV